MAGNLESLKNIMAFNRAQKPGDEEDVENNECPYHAWPLDENEKGYKSCPIGGEIWFGNRRVK